MEARAGRAGTEGTAAESSPLLRSFSTGRPLPETAQDSEAPVAPVGMGGSPATSTAATEVRPEMVATGAACTALRIRPTSRGERSTPTSHALQGRLEIQGRL